MTSAAYDYRQKPAARRTPPQVQVVRGGRYSRLGKARQLATMVATVLAAALVLGLIVSVVHSQARITELTGEIAAANKQLTTAQSVYDDLSIQMEAITNRSSVAEVAVGRLGLAQADQSQITYLRLEDESVIERTTSDAAKLLGGFRTAALSLIGSLDP